jgi:hypothetical protein
LSRLVNNRVSARYSARQDSTCVFVGMESSLRRWMHLATVDM